jgi:hypothetical protein
MNHYGDPYRNWFNNGIPCRFKYENNQMLAIFGFEDFDYEDSRVAIWVTAPSTSMSPVKVVLDRGEVDVEASDFSVMVMRGKDTLE